MNLEAKTFSGLIIELVDDAMNLRVCEGVEMRKSHDTRKATMTDNMTKAPDWVFRLGDDTQGLQRVLGPGISTRIFVGEQAMLSVVQVEPHSQGRIHKHPEEQWGVLLKGECIRIQGDEEVRMKAGDFWHTPGGVLHGIRTGASSATILDVFSPPREEYRKAGSGFGTST